VRAVSLPNEKALALTHLVRCKPLSLEDTRYSDLYFPEASANKVHISIALALLWVTSASRTTAPNDGYRNLARVKFGLCYDT